MDFDIFNAHFTLEINHYNSEFPYFYDNLLITIIEITFGLKKLPHSFGVPALFKSFVPAFSYRCVSEPGLVILCGNELQ